jgi:Ni,Fe-hydrogenase III large subunit/Ni,Fe-hydrogenase III component G
MTKLEILSILKVRLGQGFLGHSEPIPDQLWVEVRPDSVVQAADLLHNQTQARYLLSVGSDERDIKKRFGVYHLFTFDEDHFFVTLDVSADTAKPQVPSFTPVIKGANWSEREIRDLLGVEFPGHPDPRRLVLADDWPQGVYPLRKEFDYQTKPEPAPENAYKFKDNPPNTTVIAMGPYFPVFEEATYFRLYVEGEKVVDVDYRGFYAHRGIEKLGDSELTYNQIPFIAERICGICGFVHNVSFCKLVEHAAGIRPPRRADFIRTIMLELERIHSHALWLGVAGHIIGFDTVLMQTWRMREPIMWLCERISGNRKTYGMNLIGGVRRDIPRSLVPDIRKKIDAMEKEWLAVIDAVKDDTTLRMRLEKVGILDKKGCHEWAAVGPVARAADLPMDARKAHPYCAYDQVDFKVCTADSNDVWGRTLVRLFETVESFKIVRQCLDALMDLSEGDIITEIREDIPPGRIAISAVEAPRGEDVHFLLTGGNNRPLRWRVRCPTYPNLPTVQEMVKGETVADVPIILGSIDPCFSCTERMEVCDLSTGDVRVYTQEELANWTKNLRSI